MKKMRYKTTLIEVIGEIEGLIWMPETECTKEFHEKFSHNEHEPFKVHWTGLRDALLRITNDGDFQNAGIAQGCIKVTRTREDGKAQRVRYWELRGNAGNEDLFVEGYSI